MPNFNIYYRKLCKASRKSFEASILGLLCKTHFPGLVQYAGKLEPAFTFAHYKAAPDVEAGNKALLIIQEFWVSLPRTTWLNTTY